MPPTVDRLTSTHSSIVTMSETSFTDEDNSAPESPTPLQVTPPSPALSPGPTPTRVTSSIDPKPHVIVSDFDRFPQWPISAIDPELPEWKVNGLVDQKIDGGLYEAELGPVACESTMMARRDHRGFSVFNNQCSTWQGIPTIPVEYFLPINNLSSILTWES
ncbi:hypothetical protein M406DRAFT_71417 [Cryphonectria parasitica EP155]|uniref:Uncharacterized protein n=1 Tax=Cryphonectria parasitica (strain ATCC 38755 / EP155) TaxID=660469 RepID=A0A9P4Y8F6_CRYP1|nr:uncharacterized protein M406DRAFT_71417 [Cryphonectria parasitica EP155]KAF3768401.1 hypothetical protein M406DRAFT_71417 [Cryphonectria parasitica EP155]